MRADHAGTFSKDRPDTPNASIEDLKEELAVLLAAADFSAGSLAAASGVPARRGWVWLGDESSRQGEWQAG
jgi:hypothetical protein